MKNHDVAQIGLEILKKAILNELLKFEDSVGVTEIGNRLGLIAPKDTYNNFIVDNVLSFLLKDDCVQKNTTGLWKITESGTKYIQGS